MAHNNTINGGNMHQHGIFGFRLRFLRSVTTTEPRGEGGGGDPQPPADPGTQDHDDKLGENGLKALQAERDANKAAKARLADLEAKLKAYEDRDKTEEEKNAEKLKQLEASSALAGRKVLQYEVAAKKGLPLELATRIMGDDKDAMLKDAETLAGLLTPKPATPKPDKSQGQGGTPKPDSLEQALAGHFK